MTERGEAARRDTMSRVQRAMLRLSNQRFLTFEGMVVAVCAAIPFILPWGDRGAPRPSISAYYAMQRTQFFYVPLTVAAMLFLVNAVVRERHWYNFALSCLLAIVILFNNHDWWAFHTTAAVTFFVVGVVAFAVFSVSAELRRGALALAVFFLALGLVAYAWLHLPVVFVAESIGLWFIGANFLLHERDETRRRRAT
jgi:hypothetical protein